MRYIWLCLASALLIAPGSALLAGENDSRRPHHEGGHGHGHKVCCPACNYECEFSVVKETEKKTFYEVECEPICIPPITFPWEKGCGGKGKGKDSDCTPTSKRCGKVKVVRVMVKQEYECSRCKCKWSAVGPDKGNGKAHDKETSEVGFPEPPAIDARLRYGGPATPVINLGQAPARSAVKPASGTERRDISRFFK